MKVAIFIRSAKGVILIGTRIPKEITRRKWLAGGTAMPAEMGAASRREGTDPLSWTLSEAAVALSKGRISSEELTKLCLARIAKRMVFSIRSSRSTAIPLSHRLVMRSPA